MLNKIKEFKPNDSLWQTAYYYRIYESNNEKWIKFDFCIDKEDLGKNYLSWIYSLYSEDCKMSLEDFILWDCYYSLDKMENNSEIISYEVEPEIAYKLANDFLKICDDGAAYLSLSKIAENTPCGNYYGI